MAKFLVVDDDRSTVIAMTALLRQDGHEVEPHTAGAHAVAALPLGSFDAVITDLDMPHVDGHAVVQAARVHAPLACVIVATARALEHAGRLLERGACMVMDKPLDYEAMNTAIADCRARGGSAAAGECPRQWRRGEGR
jgi:DNA-binding NtrC family response regulator